MAQSYRKERISVAFLLDNLRGAVGAEVEVSVEGQPAERYVREDVLHRPGLVLAGYIDLFTHERVQVLGNTEIRFLQHLTPEKRQEAVRQLMQFEVPCVFVTSGNAVPAELIQAAQTANVPVYSTPEPSVDFMQKLRDFLRDQFAQQKTVHASLIDVYGVGIMLMGKAGIGKSEIALDLVERGHRLVADDVVIATRKGNVVMGAGTELGQHFMEIRGLGLVDVRAMFGIRAIRFQKRVELVVDLHLWDPDEEYTRLGMIEGYYSLLGLDLPVVKLPIVPGKNITVICEVIAMNYLLQHYGYDAAEIFAHRLSEQIKKNSNGPGRGVEYFESDTE
ncbi:MAG: HPr(Ser) kinase/phosphatase [Bacteroidota bacterium]